MGYTKRYVTIILQAYCKWLSWVGGINETRSDGVDHIYSSLYMVARHGA